MSQITLVGDRDHLHFIQQQQHNTKIQQSPPSLQPAQIHQTEYHPIKEELYQSDCGSEEDEEQNHQQQWDPPVIHMLKFGDTIKSIASKYQVTAELITRANRFDEVSEEILTKRKFVVIPSASTFQEYIFEVEQEHHELARNFCFLFNDCCYDQADFYLAKCGYNLAIAIENYHFDLV